MIFSLPVLPVLPVWRFIAGMPASYRQALHTGNQVLLVCDVAGMEARPPCLLFPLQPLRRRARARWRRWLTPSAREAGRLAGRASSIGALAGSQTARLALYDAGKSFIGHDLRALLG